jgi:hypothetical protein
MKIGVGGQHMTRTSRIVIPAITIVSVAYALAIIFGALT